MNYQVLNWDSDFFGITVARIIPPGLDPPQLKKILARMGENGVKLAYWSSDREIKNSEAQRLGGNLVDRKTTFHIDLRRLNPRNFISTKIVEPYTSSMPIADLEALAIQSGPYSRFSVDPKLPEEKFIELYKIWINRSLKKEIADEVLVIREGENVVGMVTLGEKDGKGDIGLIAVERDRRGRKYGEALVRAAQCWFIRRGYEFGQAVTQGGNIPACSLYKKCGYSVEKVEYFYHFWL